MWDPIDGREDQRSKKQRVRITLWGLKRVFSSGSRWPRHWWGSSFSSWRTYGFYVNRLRGRSQIRIKEL